MLILFDQASRQMRAKNLLFIISDEHQAVALSCANHPIVRTPHIDRLAERGTRFTAAYTPCPICVPARASLATGRYVHQTRYWDNAMGYDGRVPGWGARLQGANVRVELIGKLHYRNREDSTGFDLQHRPMHLMNGIGQVWGSVRDPIPGARDDIVRFGKIGAGYSKYNSYDEAIRDEAVAWLRDHAIDDRAWMLFVGFVAPHFPLIAPQRYVDLYPPDKMPLPKMQRQNGYVRHPWLDAQETFMPTDVEFGLDDEKRRRAISAYYALCTMMNDHIGAICAALDDTGLARSTFVIYTSDHGEALGQRGHWGKSSLYAECTQIPLVITGPDVPGGHVCDTPVNLVDLAPTFLSAFGLSDWSSPVAPCSKLHTSRRIGSGRASPSITRSALRPEHLCCGKAAGSTTNMSDTNPSYLISMPTRTKPSTERAIRRAPQLSPKCAASCGELSTPRQRTGRPRRTNGRSSTGLAGARSHSEWEQKARRRPLMHDLRLAAYPKWHPQ